MYAYHYQSTGLLAENLYKRTYASILLFLLLSFATASTNLSCHYKRNITLTLGLPHQERFTHNDGMTGSIAPSNGFNGLNSFSFAFKLFALHNEFLNWFY